nr:hypothetical protein [Okeania sp. SIO2F4]
MPSAGGSKTREPGDRCSSGKSGNWALLNQGMNLKGTGTSQNLR